MHLSQSVLGWPLKVVGRYLGYHAPEAMVKIRYFLRFGKFLNLKTPKDLNEKILYLSLRTDTRQWSDLTDKYKVREYIESLGLGSILVQLYGVYDRAEDIDFTRLPKRFVIKVNHGSGDIRVIRNKQEVNRQELVSYFDGLLKTQYGSLEGGKHYFSIAPKVIIEELLENDPESERFSSSIIDYKFWCFNGEPHYCLVCNNRDHEGLDLLSYDMEWNAHPEHSRYSREYRPGKPIPKPRNFDEMLSVCRKLAHGFPCVRVDLYNIGGKIYFGEMTFTSLGGMMNYYTPEFLLQAGSEITL